MPGSEPPTDKGSRPLPWIVSSLEGVNLFALLAIVIGVAIMIIKQGAALEDLQRWREDNRGLALEVALIKASITQTSRDMDRIAAKVDDVIQQIRDLQRNPK